MIVLSCLQSLIRKLKQLGNVHRRGFLHTRPHRGGDVDWAILVFYWLSQYLLYAVNNGFTGSWCHQAAQHDCKAICFQSAQLVFDSEFSVDSLGSFA